jgi:hypothetical protein
MDNLHIDITAEGDASLAKALEIVSVNAPGGKATHFLIKKYKPVTNYYPGGVRNGFAYNPSHSESLTESTDGVITLVLLWHAEGGAAPLPYPLQIDKAVDFVKGWLDAGVDWGREPDHDGDNGHGWRVFTEGWGHVAGLHYAVCAVQPAWAMYGK